jgi:hypothetical protein
MLNSFGVKRKGLNLAQPAICAGSCLPVFFCISVLTEGIFLMTAWKELKPVIKKMTEGGTAWNQLQGRRTQQIVPR